MPRISIYFISIAPMFIGFLRLTLITLIMPSMLMQAAEDHVQEIITSRCIQCHDSDTETSLNFASLSSDKDDPKAFQSWVHVYDRIERGDMPPASEPPLDSQLRESVLASLASELTESNLGDQAKRGRVPARRLTKLELSYTLQDLLHIDADVTANVPDEVDAGTFDTVGSNQRISAIHMESYLAAADEALSHAMRLGENPFQLQKLNFVDSEYLNEFHEKRTEDGGSITRKTNRGVALFRDVDYLTTSFAGGCFINHAGIYRLVTTAAAYQSDDVIVIKLLRKEPSGGTHLLLSHDLIPGQDETLIVESYFNPGDTFYTTFQMKVDPFVELITLGSVHKYKGPGVEILSQECSGPLSETWPPLSTRLLLGGLARPQSAEQSLQPVAPESELESALQSFAARAFRKAVQPADIEPYKLIANEVISQHRGQVDAIRQFVRSMLCSTEFLIFNAAPGKLDDYSLASRLSYFLWKSMPDDELFLLAQQGKLQEKAILHAQIDRMLDDVKSERFVNDFIAQWLRLNKLNVTTPDEGLYPEFDELLAQAIPKETELFFGDMVRNNLPLANLIDARYTFVNRRLAEHYKIPGVEGQQFRKVLIPANSIRGGVLTQAAILKTTANGTTTSPVMRGNFVLTNLLGTPPPPPPPGVSGIEPDTRGRTTIREILEAHRELESCNRCHREIDPPGFALECFDPIGGFRSRYRASGQLPGAFGALSHETYHDGPRVDPSGKLSDGTEFKNLRQFREWLLTQQSQIARNFIAQLVVYSTGATIQFADREIIDNIRRESEPQQYLVRDLIHRVIESSLFQNL